jgi:CO/xanthine dehydrogenase FAD-binding subunit
LPKAQAPLTLTGLARVLARDGKNAIIVNGADSILPVKNRTIVNVGRIPKFSFTSAGGKKVTIPTGATLGQALAQVRGENGLLKQAISMMANPLVRNRVTLLEALAPDSHYFDLATALLALQASVRLQSTSDSRLVPMADYLLEFAGEPKPGLFPSAVEFMKLEPERRVGFFRMNSGPAKNTVSAAVLTRLRRNIAVDPKIYVSSSTVIPVYAPEASKALTRMPLGDNNVKMAAQQAGQEMLELADIENDPYESSLVEVAVSRAIRRLQEAATMA